MSKPWGTAYTWETIRRNGSVVELTRRQFGAWTAPSLRGQKGRPVSGWTNTLRTKSTGPLFSNLLMHLKSAPDRWHPQDAGDHGGCPGGSGSLEARARDGGQPLRGRRACRTAEGSHGVLSYGDRPAAMRAHKASAATMTVLETAAS